MTSISVIIPAYEHLQEVLTCLSSLQAFASRTIDIEFIVADDASPSVLFPALIPSCAAKVIRRPVNGGFAANCNTGAMYADGDILLFVKQDVYAVGQDVNEQPFSPNWDVALVNAFADDSIGAVGAKLIFPDGKIQSCGGELDAHCQPYHRCLGYADHTYTEVNTGREVTWTTGAAIAIRAPLFKQLKGFDEAYERGYFEDADLCMRVREAGLKVWYAPDVQFVHSVGTTGGSPYFMKNAARFRDTWVTSKKAKPDTYQLKERWW